MHQFIDVPLPKLSNLLKSIIGFNTNNNKIIESWVSKEDLGFLFSRSSWSLYFIAKLRQYLFKKETLTIWIPDYFCNSALIFLRKLKVNFIFYPISNNGTCKESKLNDLLKENPHPDLFIATHFFGNEINLDVSLDFCKRFDAWLIEDCAHIFQSKKKYTKAHFSIFSPYKYLAIPEGAILRINMKKFLKENKETFFSVYKDILKKFKKEKRKIYFWILKRIIQKVGFRRKLKLSDFHNDLLSNESEYLINPKISSFSLRLFSFEEPDFEMNQNKRWKNYNSWKLYLDNELFDELELTSPYLFSYKLDSKEKNFSKSLMEDVDKKIIEFLKAGIPVYSWPDLPPEVLEKPSNHEFAINLRNKTIFLPINSSIRPKLILEKIEKIFKLKNGN